MQNFKDSLFTAPIDIVDDDYYDEDLEANGGIRVSIQDENGNVKYIYGEKAKKIAQLAIIAQGLNVQNKK